MFHKECPEHIYLEYKMKLSEQEFERNFHPANFKIIGWTTFQVSRISMEDDSFSGYVPVVMDYERDFLFRFKDFSYTMRSEHFVLILAGYEPVFNIETYYMAAG